MADDELIDVVDEWGRPLAVLDRRTAHAQGAWHRVTHILLVADRNGTPVVILQERAPHKETFAGLLDLSATGHLSAGESPVDGRRELHEELGVEVDPAALVPLGVRRIVDEIPGGVNRELVHVFLARDDRPLEDYRPDPAEVSAVLELPLTEGIELVSGDRPQVECTMRRSGAADSETRNVARDDLVPEPTMWDAFGADAGYWTVVLVMAERLMAGRPGLAI